TPPPEPPEQKTEYLTEEQLHSLYSGAPHFGIQRTYHVPSPVVAYPWGNGAKANEATDSVPLAHAAFYAATLVPQYALARRGRDPDEYRPYEGYEVDVAEVPSMLSAQGTEPGTVGFGHFLQLPISDSLVTNLQQMQTSDGSLQAVRNKALMQSNPEKLGIRKVRTSVVYERLVEFCDLHEAFADSPERMTILNNQSSGDLYANLFGKFLMPPRYDGTTADPTGQKVQIDTLLRILSLKGVWYDFSLVEWRIRLGQILWSDPDAPDDGHDGHGGHGGHDRHAGHAGYAMWPDRNVLLLQITLACELLLRLDAVSPIKGDESPGQKLVSTEEYQGFHNLGTKKTDWDLIVARRFLENILVVPENVPAQTPRARGLLSMLSAAEQMVAPEPDIVILPRHQSRQLSGLLAFAESMQWPDIETIVQDLAHKLGVINNTPAPEGHQPHSQFLDPPTPASISVYGTPLTTPQPIGNTHDGYFGNLTRPALSRSSTARSLMIPLSTMLLAHAADDAASSLNIGGWLSRSWLTGLVLPGEAISHFLMSTLLENDKLAITALGDSANLYGGFIYSGRSWWSKSSIVGRVLACTEGVVESIGWIMIPHLPEEAAEAWYSIASEDIQPTQPYRITSEEDLVAKDSSIIPGGDASKIQAQDLVAVHDDDILPTTSIKWTKWNLTPSMPASPEMETPGCAGEMGPFTASLTFTSTSPCPGQEKMHTLTLKHDVQFISSFPCNLPSTSVSTPPTRAPCSSAPATKIDILKRSRSGASTLSMARRNSSTPANGTSRPSLLLNRRNSHGFEPLMSHPPDSPLIAPIKMYGGDDDDEVGNGEGEKEVVVVEEKGGGKKRGHVLHNEYKYKIMNIGEVLEGDKDSPPNLDQVDNVSTHTTPLESTQQEKNTPIVILILDARGSRHDELVARAWCAEQGVHALIGRVGRTCLACCVREARGLGVGVVVRV
ncbi:hypothetical protein P154DRAFT_400126, partial [Amniculicola lignicola CBS 123094]